MLLMKRVNDTQDEEINCSACLDQVSEYIDMELSGIQAAERMSQVKHHLGQCSVCMEEYQVLRSLAQYEAEDRLPTNEELAEQLKRLSK